MDANQHIDRMRETGFTQPEDARAVLDLIGTLVNKIALLEASQTTANQTARLIAVVEGLAGRIQQIELQMAALQRSIQNRTN